jgi:hypothetical protein
MTIFANTYTTYDTNNSVAEQVMDTIYNIAPTATPFLSGCKRGKAENINFEWLIDTLAAAANNSQLDGDDIASVTAVTQPVRTNNQTQISRKVFAISGTEQAVRKYGRKDEIAYQVGLKMAELKRDMETALTQNSTKIVGNTTTARQTRGLDGWTGTNNSLGGGAGAAPAPATNTAAVNGTQRSLTEAMLKDIAQKCFTAGGNPDTVLAPALQKQAISTFTGNATRMDKSEDQKLYAAIDVYVSDFGSLTVIPDRFSNVRNVHVLEMGRWAVNYLRPFTTVELAKTGDADKRMIVVEYGLQSSQEAASGTIRDLL